MHDGGEEKKTLQVLQANISSRLQHTVAFIIYAYQSVFASVFFLFLLLMALLSHLNVIVHALQRGHRRRK